MHNTGEAVRALTHSTRSLYDAQVALADDAPARVRVTPAKLLQDFAVAPVYAVALAEAHDGRAPVAAQTYVGLGGAHFYGARLREDLRLLFAHGRARSVAREVEGFDGRRVELH